MRVVIPFSYHRSCFFGLDDIIMSARIQRRRIAFRQSSAHLDVFRAIPGVENPIHLGWQHFLDKQSGASKSYLLALPKSRCWAMVHDTAQTVSADSSTTGTPQEKHSVDRILYTLGRKS